MVINSTNHLDVRAGVGKLVEKPHCVSLIRLTLAIFQIKTEGKDSRKDSLHQPLQREPKIIQVRGYASGKLFPIIHKEK